MALKVLLDALAFDADRLARFKREAQVLASRAHLDSNILDAKMSFVRTTVTLDPDTEASLRRLMRERGLSFKEALNQAIRLGSGTALHGRHLRSFRQKTYRMGAHPEFRWDKALQMAAAMEDEELTRKLQARK